MQEVFEKIIYELDKSSGYYEFEEQGREHVQMVDLTDAIEIVKQAAAEYNGGWIPCSERLPEDDCIVWVSFSNPYRNYAEKAMWAYDFYSTERCFKWGNGKRIKETPVAWKPYYPPEPYHPKRYRANCKNRHENGNCIAVGGFCTSVRDKYCQYKPK